MEIELQIAAQYMELRTVFWNFVLYWTSVSFGLMVAAHVAARNMHMQIIVMITFLYVAFTVWLGYAFYSNTAMVYGFMEDLRAIGELESKGAASILLVHERAASSPFAAWSFLASAGGTFLGTITFLWYSHLKSN